MCSVRPCAGVADQLVFVFNVMHPLAAIKPYILEASEDKLRLPKLFLGEAGGSRLVCGNSSPKGASLGWEFGSSCSVGGLWLSWGSMFVTFLPAVSFSVSASLRCCCESITCFLLYGKKNLKESIRRIVFFSGNSGSSNKRYFPSG